VLVGLAVAFIGTGIDRLFDIPGFRSLPTAVIGCLLLGAGFLLRVWATFYFHKNGMKVISLMPQRALVTSGPYRFSRNPLYLGGNVFIFLGAALLLGSPAALAITILHLPFVELFIRREEKQLEQQFGEDWRRYKSRVGRWV
jgi:protein-S-isoprenylcysteine O-methyltransferase Ste14